MSSIAIRERMESTYVTEFRTSSARSVASTSAVKNCLRRSSRIFEMIADGICSIDVT